MKVALCEIKKNLQGTNCDKKETTLKSTVCSRRKKENIQLEQNEETKIQKNEEKS